MPISIKNEEAEKLARQLSVLTGESLTEAIQVSLAERLERLRRAGRRPAAEELNAIAERCTRLPVVSGMTDDEILGYDERGIPTR